MRLQLELDYPVLRDYPLAGGATLGSACDTLAQQHPDPLGQLRAQAGHWPVGWLDLPQGGPWVDASCAIAARLRDEVETLIVCGIGGSALGAQAVLRCLDLPGRRLRRVVFIDNLDPGQQASLLEQVDLKHSAVNVISKSGGTLETMSSFLYVLERLQRAGLAPDVLARRVVATTDQHKGVLRQYADAEGWATLPVPDDVGGRFSVFTAVGLLPLAYAGVDVQALLTGARELQDYHAGALLADSPAWKLAAVHYLLHTQGGIHDTVHYIYGDPLVLLGDWFRQLWAESLSKATKVDGSASGIGQTPVIARGSTDQHSQNQLFMEGPGDKLYTFITCTQWPMDPVVPVPAGAPAIPFASFTGRRFGELLDACRCGTRDALVEAKRPVCDIVLPMLSAEAVGEYMQLWMLATGYAGLLYQVNPFDQPGVERSKQIAMARLAGG
jgi:glucose-6-phosphate isomerase